MSYCLNPSCSHPENPAKAEVCQACGLKLLLRDRYRVKRALGKGGFGATFLARDFSLPGHPYCVIKQLQPAANSPHVMQMARDLFKREAKTLGKIGNHPQLPRLLDYFESNQEFYLVQEYVCGITLQQEVKRGGPFTEAGVKQFLSEILPVLNYIHQQQVIHRDIKPGNIIRREQDKKLVLIDFGAVKDKVNPERANASEQTALTAYAIGTPGYAPPEQMAMRPVYASDIYALGVTCLYLLTGQSPKDLAYDPVTGEVMWREQVHVSSHFADVLQKTLEVSVKHRYQSAEEVLRALDLEPYLDSLAQNMAVQGTTSTAANASPMAPPERGLRMPDSSAMTSSPSARVAAAIRARRARSGYTTSSVEQTHIQSQTAGYSGGSRQAKSPTTSSGTSNSGGQAKLPTRMDEDGIKLAYGKGRRDFSACDLSLLDLRKTTLAGANFNQSKLQSTRLHGANLSNANFSRANLGKAILRNANLERAYLGYANLEGTDLRGADLSHAHLSNASLRGANLCGADLTGARIDEIQLEMAKTNWSTIYPNGRRGIW
ncbi:MAG: protein kinase domain-containing protein [Thainema sp.]